MRCNVLKLPAGESDALRVGAFRNLWLAETISLAGSEVTSLALPTILVLRLNSGALELSLLNVAQYTALLLALVWAGNVADRRAPRVVMVLADVVRLLALASVVFAGSYFRISVWHLAIVGLVIGAGSAFFDTTYSAALPRILDAELLPSGNSLYVQSQYFASCVGPPLGGLLIGVMGASRGLSVDCVSFAISGVLISLLRGLPKHPHGHGNDRPAATEVKGGSALIHVWRNPRLRLLSLTVATGNLGHQVVQAVYFIYLYRSMLLSASQVGAIFGLGGIAGIFGARLAAPLSARVGPGRTLMGSTVIAGGSWLIVFAPVVPAIARASVAATSISLSIPLFSVVQATLRQRVAPIHQQGLAVAGVQLIGLSTVPVGFLVGGLVGQIFGVPLAIVVGALMAASSGLWCVPLLSHADDIVTGPIEE